MAASRELKGAATLSRLAAVMLASDEHSAAAAAGGRPFYLYVRVHFGGGGGRALPRAASVDAPDVGVLVRPLDGLRLGAPLGGDAAFVAALLAAQLPAGLARAPADAVRALLSAPLPRPIVVHGAVRAQSQLPAALPPGLPVHWATDSDTLAHDFTPQLETLLRYSFDSAPTTVAAATEEVWASLADTLTGGVWRTLSRLVCGGVPFTDNRNSSDSSKATTGAMRPDYGGYIDAALVIKAEHKRNPPLHPRPRARPTAAEALAEAWVEGVRL